LFYIAPMGWGNLGIGLFVAGGVLIATGLAWDASLPLAQASRVVPVSAEVKRCAADFDDLSRGNLTKTRAQEVMRVCDVAVASAPRPCSQFVADAGRAGFTAGQEIGTGHASDLEPYQASRRDAIASRQQCKV
jgi:hypothetical protein